jgi:hypothetical protein
MRERELPGRGVEKRTTDGRKSEQQRVSWREKIYIRIEKADRRRALRC